MKENLMNIQMSITKRMEKKIHQMAYYDPCPFKKSSPKIQERY
jgi:hypothetical protein